MAKTGVKNGACMYIMAKTGVTKWCMHVHYGKDGCDKMVHACTSRQRRVCLPSVGFGICRRWNQHQSQSYQPVCLPLCLSVCLSGRLSVCPSGRLSVCLSLSVFACLLVRLCPWFVFDSRAYVMMLVWLAYGRWFLFMNLFWSGFGFRCIAF